jgi:hypothetical protein
MLVRVTRRGGLAGIPMRGDLETSQLPPDEARLAEEALHQLSVGTPPTPPRHPDAFQYEIAFSAAEGAATQSAVIDEADVSEALRPVIDTAMSRATLC